MLVLPSKRKVRWELDRLCHAQINRRKSLNRVPQVSRLSWKWRTAFRR